MKMSFTTVGIQFSAQSLRANDYSNRALPPWPQPSTKQAQVAPSTPEWLDGDLIVVSSILRNCSLYLICLPQPLGQRGWFPCQVLSSPASSFSSHPPPPGETGQERTPSPPREPKSPLALLHFCFKAFSSMEVNMVSIKGAIYKALYTHKVLALPAPSPQQAGREQGVLRMGPGSHRDSTKRLGPGPGAIGAK